jgi:hypothetical protein
MRWAADGHPVGNPTIVGTEKVTYAVTGDVADAADGNGLVATLHVDAHPRLRAEQTWRMYEAGRFHRDEANRYGNGWTLGALAVGGLTGALLTKEPYELDGASAAVAGLIVSSPMVVVGLANYAAPLLPELRRKRSNELFPSRVDGEIVPATDVEVQLRAGGATVATGTTNERGDVRLDFAVPDADVLQPVVPGRVVPGSTFRIEFDLRRTQAWRARRREQLVELVTAADFDGARAIVSSLLKTDDTAWDTYCSAFPSSLPTDEAELARRTSGFRAPLNVASCRSVWMALDAVWSERLSSVAAKGEAEAFFARSKAILSTPESTHPAVSQLRDCVRSGANSDALDALSQLEELERRANLGKAAVACVAAAKSRRQVEASQARVQQRFQDRITRTYLGYGMMPEEAVGDALACWVAMQDYGRGCNRATFAQWRANWCQQVWTPTVKESGAAAARSAVGTFCDEYVEHNAPGTFEGRPLDVSRARCSKEMIRWCE